MDIAIESAVTAESREAPAFWKRTLGVLRSTPVLVVAGLFAFYVLAGFFLVDPLARKALPWVGEKFLASRLTAQRVAFNPFTLELQVEGLALAEQDGALLAGFDRLDADLESAGLARWAWRVRNLAIERPRVNVAIRKGGALNWGALLARVREQMGPPSDSMARLLIDRLRIADGNVSYVDADRPGEPFQNTFTPLGIELEGLSTLPEDRGGYLLSAKLAEHGATLRWKGDVSLNPLSSKGELAVEGARLSRLVRGLATALGGEASGTLGFTMRYRFAILRAPDHTDVASFDVRDAEVVARDFALAPRGGGAPLLQLAEARMSDVAFDLDKRTLKVGSVLLTGGKLQATRDVHGALDWQALVRPGDARPSTATQAAPGAPWSIAIGDLRLADWSAQWTDQGYERPLSAHVDGFQLQAALSGQVGAETRFSVGPLQAAVGPVQLTSGAEPMAEVRRAALSQAQLEWPQQRVAIESIALSGVRTNVLLDAQQRLNWVEMLRRIAPAVASSATPAPDTPPALPDLRIARVAADDIQVRVVDASPGAPVTLDIAQGAVAVRDVGLDFEQPWPVEAKFAVQQGGRFEARGSVVPAKSSGQFDLALAGFALQPLAPYVNRFARLHLKSGAASTRGKLAFAPGAKGVKASYQGGFAVDDLAITEEDSGEPFLGWKKLSTDSLSVALGPDRARIGELVATRPLFKVIIFEDQTLNLQHIRRAPAAEQAKAPAPAPAGAAPDAAIPFPLAIERLRIVDADAEFADLSLTPRFGTKMQELSGIVTGLSTDAAATAQVELDGKVDDYGSARIRGTVQPFRITEATDLALAFRNLEMTRLTPYSGKFAGRRIESGRLSVDLQYKIQQRQLAGTNKFVVNKLKLGEAVDSPGAMKLPLDLAIALLQDSNGVIDLDLPVSGSLDDPQFSYGAIVWKAIVNVLTKVVTAPFRALAGLLGGNSEKFESAGFDPGSSALLPPEQEKTKALADALTKRPALTLTIQPGFDPEADRRALQEATMRKEAAAVAGVQVPAGESPGPVDVNVYKVRTWLEDRYVKEAGQADYDKLRASYKNPEAGAVAKAMDAQFIERLGRRFKERDDGPASPFHTELLQQLTRKVPVADEALVQLAQARGDALRSEITKSGLDASRVTVAAPRQQSARDKLVATGFALGAGGAAPAEVKTSALP